MKKTIITNNTNLVPLIWTEEATCVDLKISEDISIKPWEVRLVWTGIKTNFANKIYIRSSMPIKKNIMLANSIAIIDADYTWEIKLQLYNFSNNVVILEKYERVAQLEWDYKDVICDEEMYNNWTELNPSWRGVWGFGSTWKN